MPIGFKNSSSSISPGGIAGPNQFGSLVIIFDADFAGMSLLPLEGNAILIVDPNAVPARLITFQGLQPIACRYLEIVDSCRHINRLELPLRDPPDIARDSARRACVPLSEQIRSGPTGTRLHHSYC